MDAKLLTENGWKNVSVKFKIKNNDLQKALAEYDKLDDDAHDDLIECVAEIKQQALTFKKSKEAAAAPAVVKYLTDMVSAAEAEHRDVIKEKAEAQKEANKKADAEAKKREEADASDDEDCEAEDEEEDDEYHVALMAAFQKLKGAKDAVYQFIVCDAKPHPGLMLAKKISSKHKAQLTNITGSKRFLHTGTCRMENGKFTFAMEKPVSGLARKLQESVKHYTGKKLPIMVGTESVDDGDAELHTADKPGKAVQPEVEPLLNAKNPDAGKAPPGAEPKPAPGGPFSISASVGRGGKNKPEDVTAVQNALNTKTKAGLKVDGKCGPKTIGAIESFQKTLGMSRPDGRIDPGRGTARALASSGPLPPAPAAPQPVAMPKLGKAELSKAPTVWHGMRKVVDTNIDQVKKAVRGHYAHEHPDLVKEIDANLEKLDGITDKLDHRIADTLAKAHAAKDEAARKMELKNAKVILADYIKYVKSEPLIAHIDSNPWVKVDLKKTLVDTMTHMAQSIG
jgi:hypothetical protein